LSALIAAFNSAYLALIISTIFFSNAAAYSAANNSAFLALTASYYLFASILA